MASPDNTPGVSQDSSSITHSKISSSSVTPPIAEEDNRRHGNANGSNHNNTEGNHSNSHHGKSTKVGNGYTSGSKSKLLVVPEHKVASGVRNRRGSSSTTDPAVMAAELRKSRELTEQMMQELAQAKVEYAEAMAVVEQKKMEARQVLLREAQTVRELDAARSYITLLEQRVSVRVYMES